jgi:surfeit locus 1 family protein
LEDEVFPFIVRLDPELPGAYRAEWQVVGSSFGPERHIAYAVTWFSMAVALIIAWLLANSNIAQIIRGHRA